jgi:hypothetical protein
MTRQTAILLICTALASGCGRSQRAHRNDQNYQVVEEGQASGVTSTINAPGETPPPLTDTSIDTTTNFTLPDNPAPLGTQPANTVAGTLPTMRQPPMASSAAARPRPPRTDTTSTEAPPATDTAVTDTASSEKTDTTKTDTTSTEKPPSAG